MLEATYGLGKPVSSFAIENEFVKIMNKGCFELGKILKPFCFFPNEIQEKYEVIDISAFEGLCDNSKTLVDEVVGYRCKKYADMGFFGLNTADAQIKRLLFIDYLLSVSLCYIEIPKYATRNGVAQKTFDKFLATKNPSIMAAWMGASTEEMQAKYSSRIASTQADFANGVLRCVKLNYTAKGTTITCPRGQFSTAEMVCTPLFMTYAFMVGAFEHLEREIVKFTYLKDNGTVRELPTTTSRDILMSYYNDIPLVDGMLGGTDMFNVDLGGLMLSSKQSRGYVRVPEVGSSRYDATGVRALNLTRILKAEVVPEVDRSFIDVDLASVVSSFGDCIDYATVHHPEQLRDIFKAMGIEDENVNVETAAISTIGGSIKGYVETMNTIFSTTFQKELHLFMAGHPQWFTSYTGKPRAVVESSAGFGVGTMDF